MPKPEQHRHDRIGWLRAAVLGANDGILSVGSILVGVASAQSDHPSVLLAGVAGLTAGALSMAAGEFVSVSSQSDTEAADRARETAEHQEDPEGELQELTNIYIDRGLSPELAHQVALQLTEHDALGTHLRDELGMSETHAARPLQAAFSSAAAFGIGGTFPVVATLFSPASWIAWIVACTTIAGLAILGSLSAWAGGSPIWKGTARVTFWGIVAMVVTSLVGKLFGVAVS
ncbi:VIT family protein [Bremerella volcania]|uniref:VIT family protein n=1 Tax=Bremerella volcania TaxID=2527984 RepID=A0A518C651_9BACT|nr:VIT family protein [Bremerella volcania]QDU74691.1 VIT family protein [Bremerella volcania]